MGDSLAAWWINSTRGFLKPQPISGIFQNPNKYWWFFETPTNTKGFSKPQPAWGFETPANTRGFVNL